MASSSSSSSSTSEKKIHVFLSFRGEDTRDNFTSHLHAALCRNKIQAFIDNDLHRGEEISESLLKAIEESKIAVIIFSKEYATSKWCLEEVAKIIECKKLLDLIVIPVFYHVDPSDVRNQTGTFGEAFVKHEERFEKRLEKVLRWRAALTEAANLSGFDSNVIRPEAALLEEIIKNILKKLNHMSPSYTKDLVGVESSIEEIELLLHLGSKDVRILELWGMGGIGKTTLARAVYNKISSQFESFYFLNDVREQSEKHELTRLGQQLLSAILEDDRHAILESTFTKNRLCNKKILIVFDDVTCSEQIEKLIGDFECFGRGSRIIITTREKEVLKNFEVSSYNTYEVKGLLNDPALTLFSRHAFKLNHPSVDFMKLSQEVVRFAKGVPLALKVLGGLLFGKTIEEWESAMHKLERNPDSKIMDVLKISYDGLDEQQKTIFLDLACFFKGADKDHVMDVFDATGLDSQINVTILSDRSLIAIKPNGEITMHDLLQKMGKKIVNEESKDPGDRSRLWHYEDIIRVLKTNKGTKTIEGIRLNTFTTNGQSIKLKPDAFSKMYNLRYFSFDWPGNKVDTPEDLEFGSTELRYFHWGQYPLKSLPINFDPENLVTLSLPSSNVEQVFNVVQRLDKLKYINLSYSKQLVKVPDLSLIPNLKRLILEGCTSLIEVPSSIQYLKKLVTLNLRGCKSLSSLPISFQSKSLKNVDLFGCSNLKRAPTITCNMELVNIDGTCMTEFPLIEYPSSLARFSFQNCPTLRSLPSTICKLQCLSVLNLSYCSILSKLPDNFGNSGLRSLRSLDLSNCQITILPDSLGQFCNLQILKLSGNNFDCIPSLSEISGLDYLDVRNCKRLQSIPNLPPEAFPRVNANNCTSLEGISDSLFSRISLGNCSNLDQNMLKAKMGNNLLKFRPKRVGDYRDILFPGNEIPEWFSIQNMGTSITLEIPPDYKLKGEYIILAVCVVVTFSDYNKVNNHNILSARCIGRDKYGKTEQLEGTPKYVYVKRPDDLYITSDHVLLRHNTYCSTSVLKRQKGHTVDFDVRGGSLTFNFYGDREGYKVKKCGVKLLCYQDGSYGSEERMKEEKEQQPER